VLTETPKILEKAPTLAINNPKAKWTNLSAKGTFGGILVAAEHHKQKAAGTSTNVEQKVTVLHVGGIALIVLPAILVLTATPKILEKAPTLAAAVDVPPRALLPTNIEPNGANLALLPALASLFLY
jgi:hypothetical protein